MNEEKKVEIYRLIREIDRALEVLKPAVNEGFTDAQIHKDVLIKKRLTLAGHLSQALEDEVDAFVTKEIQGDQQ